MIIDPNSCFECGAPKEEDHHVVPKSLGGTRSIPLCKDHHDMIHGRNILSGHLSSAGRRRSMERAEAEGRPLPLAKIGRELKEKILDLRMWERKSQLEIAVQLGISQKSVSNFLRSVGRPGTLRAPTTNQRVLFDER